MNQATNAVQAAPAQTFDKGAYVKNHGGTTSGAIRALSAEGKSRGEIAKLLQIRYQWVRNVLVTPIKKAVDKTVVKAEVPKAEAPKAEAKK